MIKITTKTPVRQTLNDGVCKIYRELINFNFNVETKEFRSIVRDVAYVKIETDELGLDLKPNGNKIISYKDVEVIREKSFLLTDVNIDLLFKSLNVDLIASNDSFTSKFKGLLLSGLLEDTKNSTLFALTPSDWEIFS